MSETVKFIAGCFLILPLARAPPASFVNDEAYALRELAKQTVVLAPGLAQQALFYLRS